MKLGFALEYAGTGVDIPLDRIRRLEALGYDSVWSAEAYGSDAITPLAYVAAHTQRLRLGTAVMQVAGRTPAMAAMQLGTLAALAGGNRVIGGLGVSGPQIVEGWYGQPWGNPRQRLRDYTLIIRQIFNREGPVTYQGEELQLPYAGADATGMGKPLKSIMHFLAPPQIWHGTGARATVVQTAEIADGWLAFGLRPGNVQTFRAWFEEGFARAEGDKGYHNFEIHGGVSVEMTDNVGAALARQKPLIALYVGGMGHEKLNFHKKRMHREGWGEAADRIHALFQAGHREEAITAVPDDYVDEGGLFGDRQRIARRWRELWEPMPYTGVTVRSEQEDAFDLMADLAGARDRIPHGT